MNILDFVFKFLSFKIEHYELLFLHVQYIYKHRNILRRGEVKFFISHIGDSNSQQHRLVPCWTVIQVVEPTVIENYFSCVKKCLKKCCV